METFAPKGNVHGPILPQFVLETPITFGAKIMYALLCDYASTKDRCWPSQKTLAERLSCSVTSVKKYLTELVDEKLIDIRREHYRSSVYYMIRPDVLDGKGTESAVTKAGLQQPEADRQQPKVACTEPEIGYITTLKKQEEKENPPLPPTEAETPKVSPVPKTPAAGGVSSLVSDFESAFALYPKKEARAYAWIAWCKLARSGQLPPLDVILASIKRFAALDNWQRDNGRYVPQMSHWIRGQRWLDPLSPAEEKDQQEQQRREEQNRAIREHQERENLLQTQRNREKALMRPLFDAFAAKFPEPLSDGMAAMASGTWMHLHSRGIAPLASDVPVGNALGIIDFMNAFKRKREEAQYRASHGQPETKRLDARADEPRPCGEILRNNPIFSRLFPESEQLRLAV